MWLSVARMLAANLDWEQPVEYEDLFIAPETNDRLTEQCRLCCQHCNVAEKDERRQSFAYRRGRRGGL